MAGTTQVVQSNSGNPRSSLGSYFGGFLASEGPTEPVAELPGEATDEHTSEVIQLTSQETEVVSGVPCRLNHGRKFEYLYRSLVDVLRRHREIIPSGLVERYSVNGMAIYYFPVLPRKYASLFAAWSGTLKYRIFYTTQTNAVRWSFFPDSNPTGMAKTLAASFADAHVVQAPWDIAGARGAIAIENSYNARPTEIAYPLVGNQVYTAAGTANGTTNFIDISIPFNTHLNFLSTNDGGYPEHVGYLAFDGTSFENPGFKIFQQMGDDFRYHYWRPSPNGFYGLQTPTGFTNMPVDTPYDIDGFVLYRSS